VEPTLFFPQVPARSDVVNDDQIGSPGESMRGAFEIHRDFEFLYLQRVGDEENGTVTFTAILSLRELG
jgi:hypothetical protein